MWLCSDDAPRARRLMEQRDQGTRAQAFQEGRENYDKDVVVAYDPSRRKPR